MTNTTTNKPGFKAFMHMLWQAVKGIEVDYTSIGIKKAIFLLAIPMMLEMMMESVFALVDLYFVGHLHDSSHAIQTVGLTESVLTVIYSLAIGMSMAATAVVARRIGEKDPKAAAKAGAQTLTIAIAVNIIISILGVIYAEEILRIMGASNETAVQGTPFIRIMMGSSTVIMLLFLINGIFRGAGNAAIAMQSLWIANIANIILCPIFINGLAFIPAYGLTGAAIATTLGRSLGVSYQIYHLTAGKGKINMHWAYFKPAWEPIKAILKIATPAILQFVIASCSWIFLAQLVATTGGDHGSAGYQTALRLMMFFILPAWGLSNAAATLVGQNLGAGQIDRAEQSVYVTIKFIVVFMAMVTVLFLSAGKYFAGFFSNDAQIIQVANEALKILSVGFILYGVGMVLVSAFNGAGDTKTPTKINVVAFWIFQIPFAYLLAKYFKLGPTGVFIAIPTAEVGITIAALLIFWKGNWKKTKV